MDARVTPFLLFDGTCAEAMGFYQRCLGGELTLMRLGDTPMKHGFPPEAHGRITYASLRGGCMDISATDWLHPTERPVWGTMAGLFVNGSDPAELRRIFDALCEGADTKDILPLREMPFGWYGRLTDRYRVGWFFRGGPQGEPSGSAL